MGLWVAGCCFLEKCRLERVLIPSNCKKGSLNLDELRQMGGFKLIVAASIFYDYLCKAFLKGNIVLFGVFTYQCGEFNVFMTELTKRRSF